MKDFSENIVLVYGPRKSGTTLLHNLLDGGGNVLVVPDEFKLKFILEKMLESPDEKKGFYLVNGRSYFRNNLRVEEKGPVNGKSP